MKYLCALLVLFAACGGDDVDSVAKLMDPNTCVECHAKYHDQWSASMHAYASDDPVFLAMNKRGQRETNNQLGTFCIQCHAPMAVALGTVTNENAKDFDPTTLSPSERGITCYFCHNVQKITDDHNNGLVLANDTTMRGGLQGPVTSPAHHSKYDPLMDSDLNESEMCGSCHDVVTPRGVALERTQQEWQGTFFAKEKDPRHHLTCGGCHMPSSNDTIADKPGLSVPFRPNGVHEHLWPGIDEALTPFPGMDVMSAGIHRDLHGAISVTGPTPRDGPPAPGGICLDPPGVLSVRVDSIGTGHSWPSGAAQDRRAWLEVTAKRTDGSIVFQSGQVADRQDPEALNDPNLLGFWDRTARTDGMPAHFFWEVATVDSKLLKGPPTIDKNDPLFDHSTTAKFNIGNYLEIDHIDVRVRIRPLPYAVLDELVASGDLAPEVAGRMKTLEIEGTQRHWDKATKGMAGTPAANTNCSPFSTY